MGRKDDGFAALRRIWQRPTAPKANPPAIPESSPEPAATGCDCRGEVEGLKARMDALEARLAAALDQSKAAVRTADAAANGRSGRTVSRETEQVRMLALAQVRTSVIAAATGLSRGDVASRLTHARKAGLAIPAFPAVTKAPTAREVAEAKALLGQPPGFDLRAAMRRMLATGVRDALFIALCRAHPDGPPADVRPPAEDGWPYRPGPADPLFSPISSTAALCMEAAS